MNPPRVSRPRLGLLPITVVAAAAAAAAPPPLEVGAPFPPVVLPSIADGAPGSIADFRGEKLVLHVFASW